jgi:hypothetical protein
VERESSVISSCSRKSGDASRHHGEICPPIRSGRSKCNSPVGVPQVRASARTWVYEDGRSPSLISSAAKPSHRAGVSKPKISTLTRSGSLWVPIKVRKCVPGLSKLGEAHPTSLFFVRARRHMLLKNSCFVTGHDFRGCGKSHKSPEGTAEFS